MILQIKKIRKNFSIKNEKGETMGSYNLSIPATQKQVIEINKILISKKIITVEGVKKEIDGFFESDLSLDGLNLNEGLEDEGIENNNEEIKVEEIPMEKKSDFNFEKNLDGSIDGKKTVLKYLDFKEEDEIKYLEIFTKKVSEIREQINSLKIKDKEEKEKVRNQMLEGIAYIFKQTDSQSEKIQEEIDKKTEKLRLEKQIEDKKTSVIQKDMLGLLGDLDINSTIKTEFANFTVRKSSSVQMEFDQDKLKENFKSLPKGLFEKVQTIRFEKKSIKEFIEEQEKLKEAGKKFKEVEFAKIEHKKNYGIKIV